MSVKVLLFAGAIGLWCAKYNQGLSVRRAEAVAGELVRDGVAREAISISGFGEAHPLVPTAAGVREPQNRRVNIILK